MSVSNGQNADQTTFNGAFVSKTVNSTTIGEVSLANTSPGSGSSVSNIQRELNALSSFTGKALNVAFDTIPSWSDNSVGASSDSLFDRADALTVRLDNHTHDGTPGGGDPISATNLLNFNNLFSEVQVITPASGTYGGASADDFSDWFSGKIPTGSASTEGVFAFGSFAENVVRIRVNKRPVVNNAGLEIFGRFDVSGSGPYTWNIDYFVFEPGSGEVSETLPSVDASADELSLYYLEVFSAATRPTVIPGLTSLIPFGGTGGGGGGGGGASVEWNADGPDAPTIQTKYGQKVASFENTSQNLYACVRVPESYNGEQMKLRLAHFINGSGSQLLRAQCTLVTAGHAINTTTFQRTSTNSAVTVTDPLEVAYTEIDLTSETGDIGGLNADPGDLILIRLFRSTDTATVSVDALISSIEVLFS